ncbi:hypothetical protein PISMIDRAFT_567534 [Pisolithus microcarpus 441]|uniref:Uncharacterized protein n=1 Tax=Pisolithus microcarpus 441 TaxID=765257 RepID=A0A0C9Y8R2_9AGAM|nr:hypothetical protein PISMIDRAFT_567534 [Pisolithus microcarpus 441]
MSIEMVEWWNCSTNNKNATHLRRRPEWTVHPTRYKCGTALTVHQRGKFVERNHWWRPPLFFSVLITDVQIEFAVESKYRFHCPYVANPVEKQHVRITDHRI